MIGMFSEVGPCEAVEAKRGSITSTPRDFGWDRSSNMLFIDQVGPRPPPSSPPT